MPSLWLDHVRQYQETMRNKVSEAVHRSRNHRNRGVLRRWKEEILAKRREQAKEGSDAVSSN